MRKLPVFALFAVCAAFALSLSVSAPKAEARPQYLKEFAAKYSNLTEQAKEMKCACCHPTEDNPKKKLRNDYGMALSKALGEDNKNVKDKAAIGKAFDAAAKAKNADGKTFGSLIEAGKLPGTNG